MLHRLTQVNRHNWWDRIDGSRGRQPETSRVSSMEKKKRIQIKNTDKQWKDVSFFQGRLEGLEVLSCKDARSWRSFHNLLHQRLRPFCCCAWGLCRWSETTDGEPVERRERTEAVHCISFAVVGLDQSLVQLRCYKTLITFSRSIKDTLGFGWRSKMENAAPNHCTEPAVKLNGPVKVHPRGPWPSAQGSKVMATKGIATYFCILHRFSSTLTTAVSAAHEAWPQ